MKHLDVLLLNNRGLSNPIREVSFCLDNLNRNLLNQVPWAQYNYLPFVHFVIAYGTDCIFLKYYVSEKFIRAANGASNTAVYQDSCVEFFIGFGDEKTYYNFEFNCIGAMRIGYGETKTERELLTGQLIREVKYQSLINNEISDNDVNWEFTVAIPLKVFCYHGLYSLEGKKCRANFYKCGDNLPDPHFVAWSNIIWPEPNFHLREFFGTLQFQ